MKNKKLLPKKGDIILAHNYGIFGWFIRCFTNSYWNHAVLYLGNGKVIESSTWGVKVRPYKDYRGRVDHKFIRVKGLSDYKRKKICDHALTFEGKSYNLGLVFVLTNKPGAFTCSQFIGKIFSDNGIILAPELLTITPADIDRNIKTYDLDNPPNRQQEIRNIAQIIKNLMAKHEISLERILMELNKEE